MECKSSFSSAIRRHVHQGWARGIDKGASHRKSAIFWSRTRDRPIFDAPLATVTELGGVTQSPFS